MKKHIEIQAALLRIAYKEEIKGPVGDWVRGHHASPIPYLICCLVISMVFIGAQSVES